MSTRDGDALCSCAQRCESQGASGDDLSPTVRMAVFSRFWGASAPALVDFRRALCYSGQTKGVRCGLAQYKT